jgi:hypothetical protein
MFAHTLLIIVQAANAPHIAPDAAQALVTLSHNLEAEAQRRAQNMARSPAAPADALPVQDPVLTALSEFSLQAYQLSRAVEDSGGPTDLGCIFRGMSEDAQHRADLLLEAATRADHARAYQEIARLTGQAAEIAATPEAQAAGLSAYSCPVEASDQ